MVVGAAVVLPPPPMKYDAIATEVGLLLVPLSLPMVCHLVAIVRLVILLLSEESP